jgi:hypothetical protein
MEKWRLEHPHDTPPYPFTPSPTSAHSSARSVLALCFAEASETYHHWRVFSPGGDGVCIEFDKQRILDAISNIPSVRASAVTYKQIEEVRSVPIVDNDLPFLKRFPYRDEQEFRLLYVSPDKQIEFHQIPVSLASISRITLSPWMPEALAKAVKDSLKQIRGCKTIKIYRSTLVENERWKKAASPDLVFAGS